MSITTVMGHEDRHIGSETEDAAPLADLDAALLVDSRLCAITGCDGEEHDPPRFGRIAVALPGRDGVQVPLCPEHYDAIVEANARRNAWMAGAERWHPDDG